MSYTNATFYVDMSGGSNTARTALTSCTASNPSGTITRINKTAHGLVTGAVVDATLFSAWLNGAWKITVVDADNFDLDGAVWQTTADADGTITPRGGSSKADAWADPNYASSSGRVQAGDTIRLKKSPDPTLVGDVTWTQNSITATLPSAVTATITSCDSAWTASANVTATASSTRKEGTASAQLVVASGFTTGKLAYFATGTLDLSAYQQVSFWFFCNIAITSSSQLSLRLCSDTTGDTTVHTIAIPEMQLAPSNWVALTHDFGANLNSSIQSVALYQDTDIGAYTARLDHIIACKASSAADSLTLTSLLGKVHNLSWQASTSYATNAKRCPTTPNRRGYQYQATTGGTSGSSEPTWPTDVGGTVTDGSVVWTNIGVADTWFNIKSISGTTLILDGPTNSTASLGRGYHGATETVATYKREPIEWRETGWVQGVSGTASAPITLSGGWDSTNMTTQDGETWLDSMTGRVHAVNFVFTGNRSWWEVHHVSFVRYRIGVEGYSDNLFRNVHLIGPVEVGISAADADYQNLRLHGVTISQAGSRGVDHTSAARASFDATALLIASCGSDGINGSTSVLAVYDIRDASIIRNSGAGYTSATVAPSKWYGVTFSGNGSPPVAPAGTVFTGCTFSDGDPRLLVNTGRGYLYAQKYNNTANDHRIFWGTAASTVIRSATDQRHTASGISWKFSPNSVEFGAGNPLELSVAKIACVSGTPRTVKIWTRRDSTDIHGRLIVKGAQLPGVPEKYVDSDPTVNTWVESSGLTFTPTENGVVEITFQVWDGVGTTNNYWIDDITVT